MIDRISELLDAGIDARTDAEERELIELLSLRSPGLDPYPRVVQTPYGLQDTNGVDVSLLRDQLSRSPLERVRRASRFAEMLRRNVPTVRGS